LKLVITVFSTVILMIYMGTFRQMAGVAADPLVELGRVRNPSPLVHAIVALVLLIAATVLAIYKPFGMTPYGTRGSRCEDACRRRELVRGRFKTFSAAQRAAGSICSGSWRSRSLGLSSFPIYWGRARTATEPKGRARGQMWPWL
jgi:hypothetical protein